MVPGSTFRYGSNFWIVILRPRASSSEPIDADASPLPSDETTPPETKMNFVRLGGVLLPVAIKSDLLPEACSRRTVGAGPEFQVTNRSSTREAILGPRPPRSQWRS